MASGSNQTFTIQADPGYHVTAVLADDVSIGPVETYTFNNVTVNHTISAGFAENGTQYWTINATASQGGTISPTGLIQVPSGLNQTFEILADPGYHVTTVLADNVNLGPVETNTFNNVTANHTIGAIFGISGLIPVVSGVKPDSAQQNSIVTLLISGQNFSGGERIDLSRNGSANLTEPEFSRKADWSYIIWTLPDLQQEYGISRSRTLPQDFQE